MYDDKNYIRPHQLGVVGGNGNGKQDNYNSMVNKNHRRLAGDEPNLCVSV